MSLNERAIYVDKMSLVMRKPDFCSAFVFATRIGQSLYFLNPEFHASSPVHVGPGRKPRRPVFSERGSIKMCYEKRLVNLIICIRIRPGFRGGGALGLVPPPPPPPPTARKRTFLLLRVLLFSLFFYVQGTKLKKKLIICN